MKNNTFILNITNSNEDDNVKKITINSNYYDLMIDDRETLLNLLLDWTMKEKNTINTIKIKKLKL